MLSCLEVGQHRGANRPAALFGGEESFIGVKNEAILCPTEAQVLRKRRLSGAKDFSEDDRPQDYDAATNGVKATDVCISSNRSPVFVAVTSLLFDKQHQLSRALLRSLCAIRSESAIGKIIEIYKAGKAAFTARNRLSWLHECVGAFLMNQEGGSSQGIHRNTSSSSSGSAQGKAAAGSKSLSHSYAVSIPSESDKNTSAPTRLASPHHAKSQAIPAVGLGTVVIIVLLVRGLPTRPLHQWLPSISKAATPAVPTGAVAWLDLTALSFLFLATAALIRAALLRLFTRRQSIRHQLASLANSGRLSASFKSSLMRFAWPAAAAPPPAASRADDEPLEPPALTVRRYSNGDRYEGQVERGVASGRGVYHFAGAAGSYEGGWANGRYDGAGVEAWESGSVYRGEYSRGYREGRGLYQFHTGDAYAGTWSRGQSHGVGLQMCTDGSTYTGQFAYGLKHGLGKYTFRNGDAYSGEYFRDAMHGYGVYTFANGHRYEGAWHDGCKQGLGRYTFRNGDSLAGHWHLGALLMRCAGNENKVMPGFGGGDNEGAGQGGSGGGSECLRTPRGDSSSASGLQSLQSSLVSPGGNNPVDPVRVNDAIEASQRAAKRAEGMAESDESLSVAVAAANHAAAAARHTAAGARSVGPTPQTSHDLPTTSTFMFS